jgi:hypothetical protein
MALNRTSFDSNLVNSNIILTHVGATEYGDGETFSVVFDGEAPSMSYNYDSEADRFDGMVAATASMKDFFEDSTRYYLSDGGGTGFRTFSIIADPSVLPYTGTYTGNVVGADVSGTYEIIANTMTLFRDDTTISFFEQTAVAPDGLSQVFNLSVNDAEPFVTTNFVNESDRDAAAEGFTWSADLGSVTEADFIALTHTVDPTGRWWYIEDALNLESITIASGGIAIISEGTVDFNETVDGAQGELGTIYYTIHTDTKYGDVVGLQETDGGAYMEYIKFFESLDQAALQAAFPDVGWSAGAAAVQNAGISAGESFDPWTDAGDFATVNYSDFAGVIGAMLQGTSDASSDEVFITGNESDVLLFESGTLTDATSGNVVTSDGTAAGTFEIRDVDDVDGTPTSTLVVTITDPSFDDHIAFQYTDVGTGTAMYRGEIYDRWLDILLNDTAKDDLLGTLPTSNPLVGS